MLKKRLAVLLSVIMVLSMTTVSFATTTNETDLSTITGGGVLEGEGSTVNVNTTITSVILPTSAAFNFTLDPQGLFSAAFTSNKIDFSALGSSEGAIVGANPIAFVNKSTFPVKVEIALEADSTDGNAKESAAGLDDGADNDTEAVFVTDPELVNSGTAANNILMYVVPSKNDMGLTSATYAKATEGIIFGDSGDSITLDFALPEASYLVERTASPTATGGYTFNMAYQQGHGNALQLGGLLNTGADWSTYAYSAADLANAAVNTSVSVQATFTLTDDSVAAATYDSDDYDTTAGAYGLLDASSTASNRYGVGPALKVTGNQASVGGTVTFTASNLPTGVTLKTTTFSYSTDGGTTFTTITNATTIANNATIVAAGTVTLTSAFTNFAKGKDVVLRVTLSDNTTLDSAMVTMME